MKKYLSALSLTALLVSACADTAVTPLSHNSFMLSTSAAPACGASGASRVASRMAAVETLRRGFERYSISGMSRQNNVRTVVTGPSHAETSYSFSGSSGSSTTTFGGNDVMIFGTHDANLVVTMFNRSDTGYSSAVDAKRELGSEWEKLVANGVSTCS